MASVRRRVAWRTVATTICAVLAAGGVPAATAQPVAPPGSVQPGDPSGSSELSEPVGDPDPSAYLPSPTADPWYSDPPALDENTPDGTILETRPVTVPWYNAVRIDEAWQLLVQTRDSGMRPVAVPSTVLIPEREWPGPGPRPILSFAVAIDGLGNTCQPSWALTRKLTIEFPPVLQMLIDRGYGVVLTDHQGPRSAYAASRMHGHALLDGIRAVRDFAPAGLQDSPAALFGYSGGGIATGGAAQVQNTYAPEMSEYLVANAIGGAPVDLGEAYRDLDGNLGSGLLRAAIFGVAREYPDVYGLLNQAGDEVARGLRDTCAEVNMASGVILPPFALFTTTPDPLSDPRVQHMITDTRVGPRADRPGELPNHPVLLFHADPSEPPWTGDQYFPAQRARELRTDWCEAGVNADYLGVPGEHVSAMLLAPGPVLDWLDRRFALHAAGEPAPDGCVS